MGRPGRANRTRCPAACRRVPGGGPRAARGPQGPLRLRARPDSDLRRDNVGLTEKPWGTPRRPRRKALRGGRPGFKSSFEAHCSEREETPRALLSVPQASVAAAPGSQLPRPPSRTHPRPPGAAPGGLTLPRRAHGAKLAASEVRVRETIRDFWGARPLRVWKTQHFPRPGVPSGLARGDPSGKGPPRSTSATSSLPKLTGEQRKMKSNRRGALGAQGGAPAFSSG